MTASPSNDAKIRKVLLATDLSARCDRALDRALVIAGETGAHLFILHAFEEFEESSLTYSRHLEPSWRAPPDAAELTKQRIRKGLHADVGDAIEHATVLVIDGEPADVIERVAALENIDLIVTGIAREGPFASRPVILGRTVETLLRRVPTPILIVRNRARGPYRHILVTTDLSEASANALQVAVCFFPDQTLHLLHAFDVPYPGAIADLPAQIESFRQTRDIELAGFVTSSVLPEEARRRIVRLAEYGQPAQLVRDYVRDRGADLVVLGTRGRGAMLEALIGSTAKSILHSLPCDALVVRGPLRRAPREA
ncbi:MAG TPA: universal stress protein [Steroidobacteraceae bacterium]|nr:universal stress protein [Steroidobacteraceae bacterium]